MTKNILTFMALFSAIMFSPPAEAQKGAFKGIITYDVTYPGMNVEPSQMAMLPQKVTLTTNGEKAKFDVAMTSMNQTMIIDPEAKTTTLLLEMMGNKVMMKPNKQDIPKGKEPIVTITTETKQIAGYTCKKAEISFGDEKSKSDPIIVYFSEELGTNKLFYDNEYRTLPGIPLEFTYKMQGRNMHMVAKTIEKTRVTSKDMEVPSGFKEMTPEQLRQMFGGN